ncbi:hypothetical protein CKF58_02590 [Psittacicella hinzii]|uniref:site-specific DNA-methyltransferase (adenine-specific) n=1 Tax=Psittacicella hinzii TaxID=2028575 RepID=A0A3A1YPU3_9GAMM|nr:hypothetical protein CKF58_02590 [Psittacicella hinzii]
MSLFNHLISLLLSLPKYQSKENSNELVKARIFEDTQNLDAELLTALVNDSDLQPIFFQKVNDLLVFNQQKFINILNNKEFLPSSFTQFKNRIGLTSNNQLTFVSNTQDVVLTWPFKDCVLEGGQSTDEQNRKEVFFNETLAYEEITKLLKPKVLSNAKRYSGSGIEENITTFRDNDNLVIKGNNLIVLSTLMQRFENKVKCIYIDPPYNTGKDSFNYNDSFNHSSWLTFMKNRLELSKKLLRDDGLIFVQCDDNEQAYLKVLMDEIFGRKNFISTLIHQRASGGGKAKHVVKGHDYVMIFAKDTSQNISLTSQGEVRGKIVSINGKDHVRNDDVVRKVFGSYDKSLDRRCFYEELSEYKSEKQIADIEAKIEKGEYVLEKHKNGKTVIVTYSPIDNLKKKLYSIIKAFSSDASDHLENLGIKFSNPKPEQLLDFILNTCTTKGDIVLDFFGGSGTTAAVAHKRNLQYIVVEQMDYISETIVPRLQMVINGENDKLGVSQIANWQGGGSFVYCELKDNASELIERINNVRSDNILELAAQIFTDYRTKAQIQANQLQDEIDNFESLPFDQQQEFLFALIDKNKLYVNYEDIDDVEFKINDTDKKFSRSFYGE